MREPLVSAVIIFLNAAPFIEEAIQSVLGQTYRRWELLLVDDGSTDASTQIARRYARQLPEQVRYFEHEGHRNLGKGASRNLGIRQALGDYVAFLDADDVWLPAKLEQQVRVLDAHPDAGMLYGNTKYWYSWAKGAEGEQADFLPALGVKPGSIVEPPRLLPLFLRGRAAVPCICSILVRRSVAEEVGGFDDSFIGYANIYEDQAFYAKLCLTSRVYIADECWDWYRQHPDGSVAVARRGNQEQAARHFYLLWLRAYLEQHAIADPHVWQALNQELWLNHAPSWLAGSSRARRWVRWGKKWVLRLKGVSLLRRLQHDTPARLN